MPGGYSMPCSTAKRINSWRRLSWSLPRMLRTWFSTVFSAMKSSAPISLYEVTAGHQLEHLALACRQGAGLVGGALEPAELAEHERGESGGEDRFAGGRPLQRGDEVGAAGGLHQVADGAGGHGVEQVALLLGDR